MKLLTWLPWLGILLCYNQIAGATEDHKAEQEGRAAAAADVINLSCRLEPQHGSWLDRTHSYLSERFCEPAAWFDGFFGDPRALEETPVGTFFRFRNELYWDQNEGTRYRLRLSANISVPRASRRLRFLISRDEDLRGEFSEQTTVDDSDTRTRLGLRYLARDWERARFDVDATTGIRINAFNPRVRGRFRYVHPLSTLSQGRYTQILFWEKDDGVGTTTRLDYEYFPNQRTQLRWTAEGTMSEASNGVDWKTSITGFHQLDTKSAINANIGAFGHTRPDYDTDEYYVNFRYRRMFLRNWLFYELQPERAWPNLDTGREGVWRFILRLEVQFENAEAPTSRRRAD